MDVIPLLQAVNNPRAVAEWGAHNACRVAVGTLSAFVPILVTTGCSHLCLVVPYNLIQLVTMLRYKQCWSALVDHSSHFEVTIFTAGLGWSSTSALGKPAGFGAHDPWRSSRLHPQGLHGVPWRKKWAQSEGKIVSCRVTTHQDVIVQY